MHDKQHAMRHTAAHVLAAAAERLYPGVKLGVGPVIENGFFYDILFPSPIAEEDLEKIEREMRIIIEEGHEMIREELSMDQAVNLFAQKNQDFKVELLRDLREKGTTKINADEAQDLDVEHPDTASVYHTGDFVDLCRGPHVSNVKEVGAFKLWKLAGAYWRGNEHNAQMQRIYGLCFETQEELDQYFVMLEEAKKRDHRKLGKELDLFVFSDLVGPGLPLWTPKGTVIKKELYKYILGINERYGASEVSIPHMAKMGLYEISGHADKFKDELLKVVSHYDLEFVLKPVNC